MSKIVRCPACAEPQARGFLDIQQVPVHVGSLWPTPEAARACPVGDLDMRYCERCGYVFNAAFDPRLTEYAHAYDNSLESSGVFRQYARELAQRLIDTYRLRDKRIVEIGCGKGAFISLLCELGPNRGLGFDTTFDEATRPSERVTFVKQHYTEDQTGGDAALVCCRHVFEHIPEPLEFLRMVRRSLGDRRDTVVYFEVPESLFIFRDESIWDLMYEHCGYFSPSSIEDIFVRAGFDVIDVRDAYGNQFLSVEARPSAESKGSPSGRELESLGPYVDTFAARFEGRKQEWQLLIDGLRTQRRKIAVWGAGGKTVSFMNFFRLAGDVETVVDINSRKQGHYLPGTGHAISCPTALVETRPDVVIVMNKNYTGEITKSLGEMGLAPAVLEA